MLYNLNQEGEVSVVVAWGITFNVGKLTQQDIESAISKLNKNDLFGSLGNHVAIRLTKRNDKATSMHYYALTKKDQLKIISLIIKQYEDYTWVSILQQEV